jgi:hypothetical protein
LWREVAALRAELASIPKATIGDVSYYGTLAEPALLVELADTRAELERLRGKLIHCEQDCHHANEEIEQLEGVIRNAIAQCLGVDLVPSWQALGPAESGEEE